MYLYKVTVKESQIEGKGVFSAESIPKDAIVWEFDPSHDLSLSQETFKNLNEEQQRELEKVGYISPVSGMWIYPPDDDPARFTNHNSGDNNLSVVFDVDISPEPFFKANRLIEEGEELTNNYLEFDEYVKNTKPEWI